MLRWPFKDPQEVLDYSIDWTLKLPANDVITSSTWTVTSANVGLTIGSSYIANSNTQTIVWLSSGTANTDYLVTNQVTTLQGRTMEQSVGLYCKEK